MSRLRGGCCGGGAGGWIGGCGGAGGGGWCGALRLLRGWVRGFLTFAIVEEARVYVDQAGKDAGVRVSKVDRREVVAPGNVSELAAPLHKASGRGVKGRDSPLSCSGHVVLS